MHNTRLYIIARKKIFFFLGVVFICYVPNSNGMGSNQYQPIRPRPQIIPTINAPIFAYFDFMERNAHNPQLTKSVKKLLYSEYRLKRAHEELQRIEPVRIFPFNITGATLHTGKTQINNSYQPTPPDLMAPVQPSTTRNTLGRPITKKRQLQSKTPPLLKRQKSTEHQRTSTPLTPLPIEEEPDLFPFSPLEPIAEFQIPNEEGTEFLLNSTSPDS